MRIKLFVLLTLLAGCYSEKESLTTMEVSSLKKIEAGETIEQIVEKAAHVVPTPRQFAYHKLEFTGFIHWGPNAFSRREWGSGLEDAALFNPSGLDTDQWCRLMRDAGMKLIVMVAKHHDGYCLWQTRYTKHGVMNSPWLDGKGDVLRELSRSCEKYGLRLGVYLSPADLYQMESPEGLYGNGSEYTKRVIPRPVEGRPFEDGRSFEFELDDYNEYFMNQLFELLTEYGPIHEVWFDGAHPKKKGGQTYTYPHWYKLIRELVPDAVIFGQGEDVRWCGNEAGRTRESEWNVIPLETHPDENTWPERRNEDLGSREKIKTAKYLYYCPAETDTSIRHGWFYRDDTEQYVRTPYDVFDIYERAVGGNSVLLLNVPPNREGKFSPRDAKTLTKTGEFIKNTYGSTLGDSFENTDSGYVLTLDASAKVNRIVVQEDIANYSQRVETHELDAWLDGKWVKVQSSTIVGYKRILRFDAVTTDRFRLRITSSRLTPVISTISAHYFDQPAGPVVIVRDSKGVVKIESSKKHSFGGEIRYTLNGDEPSANSTLYTEPFELPWGGNIAAAMFDAKGNSGEVSSMVFGIPTSEWKVLSASSEHSEKYSAQKVFDDNPQTFWHTSWAEGSTGHPHYIAIDMGATKNITGFFYIPRQDGHTVNSMIEKWRFETSTDGTNWEVTAEERFDNLENDPSVRYVKFDAPVTARYFKLVSLDGVKSNPYAGAAEIGIFADE